jgi:xanthine/CO dehydrogenase XdhC/CoxF family maturation factor
LKVRPIARKSAQRARRIPPIGLAFVGGGVVEVAEEVLRGGSPRLLHFGIADSEAWDVGLPCGGEIDVFVERFEP